MIKAKYILLFLVVLIFNQNCKSPQRDSNVQNLISSWRLSEIITLDKDNPELDALISPSVKRELVSSGVALFFFPDSTFTELDGYFTTHGKWSVLENSKIQFGEKTLTIDKFSMKKENRFLEATIFNRSDNLNSVLRFVESEKTLVDYKNDPFHENQNQWRQKPIRKESNEEIRNRLLNYILHYASILDASIKREKNTVSFAHSMGIIQVFRGGIGRVPKNKVINDWTNCFYDEDDAMKAYDLFSSYLNRGVYKGGTTGSWVNDDYDILMTIYDKIKK